MSGVRAQPVTGLGGRRDRRETEQWLSARAEDVEQVVLLPHHALRHAGGATGVEEQEVLAAPSPRRDHTVGALRDHRLVRHRPLGAVAGLVGHDVPTPHLRQPTADALEQRRERRVEHDRLGVGVVEQVDDLFGPVPVVRVHRREAALERPDVGLEVLDAVVEVRGHLRLVLQAGVDEVGREGVRPPIELAPRHDPRSAHLARGVGDRGGDRLVDVGEGPVGHGGESYDRRRRRNERVPVIPSTSVAIVSAPTVTHADMCGTCGVSAPRNPSLT